MLNQPPATYKNNMLHVRPFPVVESHEVVLGSEQHSRMPETSHRSEALHISESRADSEPQERGLEKEDC